MDHVLWTTILTLCISSSLTIDVPNGVQVKYPSRYRVQAKSDKTVELRVVDNKTECERLIRTKTPKRTTNKDVIPSVATAYTDGGYRANITWEFIQTGKRLPRVFLINFTFYDIGSSTYQYISDTCVLLRVTGNRKVKTKGLFQFYFDCLPLLDRPDVGLVVQLWSYSTPGRLCRSQRSIPQKRSPCGPNVKCSREYSFPISKNAHSFEYCTCYINNKGIPKLNWEYDHMKERFFINFTNVPPYLQTALIEIVESKTEERLVEDIIVGPNNIQNGEIHAQSQKFGIGIYTVYVCAVLKFHLQCEGPRSYESIYKQEIEDRCEAENNYFAYRSQTLTVTRLKPDKSTLIDKELGDDKRLPLILGVLGGLLVVVAMTGTTFYFCQRTFPHRNRSSHESSSNETEMVDLSGRRLSMINNETAEHETEMTRGDTRQNLAISSSKMMVDDTDSPDKEEKEHLLQSHNDRSTEQTLDLFLYDHPFLNTGNSRLHTICESDLNSEELSPNIKTLIDCLKPSFTNDIPVDFQMKIMQLNKDSESMSSEEFDEVL